MNEKNRASVLRSDAIVFNPIHMLFLVPLFVIVVAAAQPGSTGVARAAAAIAPLVVVLGVLTDDLLASSSVASTFAATRSHGAGRHGLQPLWHRHLAIHQLAHERARHALVRGFVGVEESDGATNVAATTRSTNAVDLERMD